MIPVAGLEGGRSHVEVRDIPVPEEKDPLMGHSLRHVVHDGETHRVLGGAEELILSRRENRIARVDPQGDGEAPRGDGVDGREVDFDVVVRRLVDAQVEGAIHLAVDPVGVVEVLEVEEEAEAEPDAIGHLEAGGLVEREVVNEADLCRGRRR